MKREEGKRQTASESSRSALLDMLIRELQLVPVEPDRPDPEQPIRRSTTVLSGE
jgi:hypothetical protein